MYLKSSKIAVFNLTHEAASTEYKAQIALMNESGKSGDYVAWYDDSGDVYLQVEKR